MKWMMLALAGVLEVTWACAMKFSEGFTQPLPSVITAAGYIASAVFLALSLKELPLGDRLCHVDGLWNRRYLCPGNRPLP